MKLTNEVKIGILVVLVITALLALTFRVGNFHFAEKGYQIKVLFYNIDGVELNAPVRLNGFEVGIVKEIKITDQQTDTKMELTLWLKDKAKLRQGAMAYVKIMGMLGEKYVGLTSGDVGAPFLAPDAVIIGNEPIDFEKLLAKGEVIAENLKEITSNISERLKVNGQAIDEIVANVNVTTKNFTSISDTVKERLVVNRTAIDQMVGNLNSTSKNLEELSEDLKLNPWKLLHKEKTKSKVE